MYVLNLVLFKFCGDHARVFQRVPMNVNMTVGQAACQLLCRYAQARWLRPAFAESSIVMCESIKRTCGCSCLICS